MTDHKSQPPPSRPPPFASEATAPISSPEPPPAPPYVAPLRNRYLGLAPLVDVVPAPKRRR
jgi:hypothetical protein